MLSMSSNDSLSLRSKPEANNGFQCSLVYISSTVQVDHPYSFPSSLEVKLSAPAFTTIIMIVNPRFIPNLLLLALLGLIVTSVFARPAFTNLEVRTISDIEARDDVDIIASLKALHDAVVPLFDDIDLNIDAIQRLFFQNRKILNRAFPHIVNSANRAVAAGITVDILTPLFKRIAVHASSFLTVAQLTQILDAWFVSLENVVPSAAGSTLQGLANTTIDTVLNSLTLGQMSSLLGLIQSIAGLEL